MGRSILAGQDRMSLENGFDLRLLSALEVLQARREADELAGDGRERALCSNACLLARALGARLVFIESYAKVNTPTRTGRLLYRFAHRFYIQWPELQEHYPNALYAGGVF